MPDPIEHFARHVVKTTYDDLPPVAVVAAKTFILDTLGVAIAGSGEPNARRLAETAAAWGRADEATVLGTGQRLPAASAAIVNAYQIHGLEFDCVHEGAVVHPMATLLSALLAQVERRRGVPGRDLLTAVAVGVDVAAGIGVACRGAMRFFRPATAGALGATAALGKVEGFDVERLVSAFGLCYGQLSGTLQPHAEGLPVLGLQIGFNARGALTAIDLAGHGFTGPREVLEGRYGYFRLYEGDAYDVVPVVDTLGRTWRVAELSHKPFPSGRLTHGVVDGLLRLRARLGFAATDVERVVAHVPPLVLRLVGRPDVPAPAPNYARLCTPFVAATALRRGTVDVPDFAPDRLVDAETHALAARIDVRVDANPDENAMVPLAVELTLRDGARHAITLDSVLGDPRSPLTREQHLAKFRRNWTYGARPLDPARGERLIELVDRLETVPDARDLIALAVP